MTDRHESDIDVEQHGAMGADDARYVTSLIRTIPDFPKQGILFRDMIPVLADAHAFSVLLEALCHSLPVSADQFDVVAGLEARGFLIGAPLAAAVGKGFVAVRKAGKLPPATYGQTYSLEYGKAKLEVEKQAISHGERVLVVDDLIATGGTAHAATELIEQTGGVIAGYSFAMELTGLNGRRLLGAQPVTSLMAMPAA